jgi:hypothetical protein
MYVHGTRGKGRQTTTRVCFVRWEVEVLFGGCGGLRSACGTALHAQQGGVVRCQQEAQFHGRLALDGELEAAEHGRQRGLHGEDGERHAHAVASTQPAPAPSPPTLLMLI